MASHNNSQPQNPYTKSQPHRTTRHPYQPRTHHDPPTSNEDLPNEGVPSQENPQQPVKTQHYLALGDSIPAGYEPVTQNAKTTKGYPTAVATSLQKRWSLTELKLTNYACSGESSTSFRRGGQAGCHSGSSQQAKAAQFLKKHGTRTKLITLHLGANNILPCMQNLRIDQECGHKGVTQTTADLDTILPRLREAAPNAKLVVVGYYNPMLTTYSVPVVGPSLATQSQRVILDMNQALHSAARKHGAAFADLAPGFKLTDWTLVDPGKQPQNLARACELTGMCEYLDIHPLPAGHRVIAQAVEAALD